MSVFCPCFRSNIWILEWNPNKRRYVIRTLNISYFQLGAHTLDGSEPAQPLWAPWARSNLYLPEVSSQSHHRLPKGPKGPNLTTGAIELRLDHMLEEALAKNQPRRSLLQRQAIRQFMSKNCLLQNYNIRIFLKCSLAKKCGSALSER